MHLLKQKNCSGDLLNYHQVKVLYEGFFLRTKSLTITLSLYCQV